MSKQVKTHPNMMKIGMYIQTIALITMKVVTNIYASIIDPNLINYV